MRGRVHRDPLVISRSHTHRVIAEPCADEREFLVECVYRRRSLTTGIIYRFNIIMETMLKISIREVRWSATMRLCSGDAFFFI